ncbi:MAG: alpha-ketoglutarate-dependent dioxygenase AlkB [Kofleriaceae bacterium]
MADEFRSYLLPTVANPFEELLGSVRFDDVTNGRRGAVLVKVDATGGIPIVRTTTPYHAPAQQFGAIHDRLVQQIRGIASLSCELNNALVEHYTNAYATMKRHSDQALDLAAGSSIVIYSCYRDPRAPSRRLLVKAKEPADAVFEIPLAHGSVIAFSLETNRRFTHAIALAANAPPNDWLGLTLRTSRTLVRFTDGQPSLSNGARLTLASDDQRREFFQLRRRENDETSFTYPPITYTISESDLRPPD